MNRKKRKARKMFLRRFGKATNPHWQKQSRAEALLEQKMAAALEALRAQCVAEAYRS